jgi:hypothetical protein
VGKQGVQLVDRVHGDDHRQVVAGRLGRGDLQAEGDREVRLHDEVGRLGLEPPALGPCPGGTLVKGLGQQ